MRPYSSDVQDARQRRGAVSVSAAAKRCHHQQLTDAIFPVTSQEIGWQQHLRNDLFCVHWDAKPQSIKLEAMDGRRYVACDLEL